MYALLSKIDPNQLPEDLEAESIILQSLTDEVALRSFVSDSAISGEELEHLLNDIINT